MIMSKQMLYYINMLLRRRLFHDYNISHSAADTFGFKVAAAAKARARQL